MVWVIDPEERNVAVHQPNTTLVSLDAAQEMDGGDVLPGFRCSVAEYFFSAGDESA